MLKYTRKKILRGLVNFSKMAIIKAENLSFSYSNKKKAIDNINIEIAEGEYIAVIGKNGSGKSTFARLLNGLLTPTSGDVIVDGVNTKDKKNLLSVRKTVGVVFQNPDNQLVASIVEDDVAFGVENIGLKREEMIERVNFALDAVNMQEFKRSTSSKLSGGQKQRVAIAGVLAVMPRVLVLDESTSMLDPKGREEVISVAEKLNKEKGITVITVTHYMDEIIRCDKVIVLDEGKIALIGTPKEVFSGENELKRFNLDVPLVTKIARALERGGIGVDKNAIKKEELAEAICKSFQRD